MTPIQHLSVIDGAFLHMESAEMPMHVGSLHRYRLPDGYQGNWYEDVKRHLSSRLHLAPVFTRKLAPMPLGLANPVWIDDDAIDLDYHVRHTVLPKPGTQAQLETLAARLHSSLMDRSRPLWEFYVIEGLADGTVGFYAKVHHAAVDGMAGVALGKSMLDVTPVARTVRAPRRRPGGRYRLGVAEMLGAALSNTALQARSVSKLLLPLLRNAAAGITASARRAMVERPAKGADAGSVWKLAPATPFNHAVTNQRAFAGLNLPLAEVKRVGKAHGASVNDVVLWLCSTALRGYLAESHELPDKSLVAGMPVSLRADGDDSMNTQATMSPIDLATQLGDALQRLQAIVAATASMKNQMGTLRHLIPMDFPSLGVPWLLGALTSLYGHLGLAERLRFANVTISNVPGVPVPLYLAGARMLDYFPLSIVVHGIALNITVQSYAGQLCFGLIACRRAVPDPRAIARHMQRAFDALLRLPQPAAAETVHETPVQAATKKRGPAAKKPRAKAAAKSPARTLPAARASRPRVARAAKSAP